MCHTQSFALSQAENLTQLGHGFRQIVQVADRNPSPKDTCKNLGSPTHHSIEVNFGEKTTDTRHFVNQEHGTYRSEIVIAENTPAGDGQSRNFTSACLDQQFLNNARIFPQVTPFASITL
ncbi:hypothetical protein DI272_30970 [Streptomyces sp. Act143]|nr:hypothetical protein DI272_30970 [Streptomyces sp. Act143]